MCKEEKRTEIIKEPRIGPGHVVIDPHLPDKTPDKNHKEKSLDKNDDKSRK